MSYLAAYHFGRPETGKYLAQFVPAHVSFVNQSPPEMLGKSSTDIVPVPPIVQMANTLSQVGPAAPLGHPPTPGVRYPTHLFSKPSPAYVTSDAQSELVEKALGGGTSEMDRSTALQHLYRSAVEALPKEKRRKQMTASFSFFEHAFCTCCGCTPNSDDNNQANIKRPVIHFGLGALTTVSVLVGGIWWLRNTRK